MAAPNKQDLEKVTIRLHSGDKDALETFYPKVGYNRAIRELVRTHIKALRKRTPASTSSSLPDPTEILDL